MPSSFTSQPLSRREFLRQSGSGLGLVAFSSVAPAFLTNSILAGTPSPERDRTILVLIQLAGGNDGLNTVIPWSDDRYYGLRPNLGIPAGETLKLDDHHAFHPACSGLHRLFNDGKLGIIQNVGYPNPNRSHFRSMEIWETASDSDDYLTEGWMGRYFDNCCAGAPSADPLGVSIGNEMPDTFLSHSNTNLFSLAPGRRRNTQQDQAMLEGLESLSYKDGGNGSFLQHTLMDTLVTERRILELLDSGKAMADYPKTQLGRALSSVGRLIAAGMETRVYFVSHGGFDTHANQAFRHRVLLNELSSAMQAFQTDLEAHGLQDQVLTMTFSEFGRRPSENASGGTDHGTAAPLFVMGSQLHAGLHGEAPNLDLPKNKDLKFSTDFRSVYNTVLRKWFDADPFPVLGREFKELDFLA